MDGDDPIKEKAKHPWETHVFGDGPAGPMSFRYPDGRVTRYNNGMLVRPEWNQVDPVTNRLVESEEATNHLTDESGTKLEVKAETSGLPPLSVNWPAPLSSPTSCWGFGPGGIESEAEDHNSEVAKIIDVLGSSGVGRRAVLKAVAGTQGITSEDELERLYDGASQEKLKVPRSLRKAMKNIGLGDMLAPVSIITCAEPDQILEVNEEAWKDIEFEVALD